MKNWVLAGAVAASVGLSSPATADVYLQLTPAQNATPTSLRGVQTDCRAWVVKLISDGAPITGADFANNGGGISGPLSQRWIDFGDETGFEPTAKSVVLGTDTTDGRNHDSHWFTNTTIAEPNPASENNNVRQLSAFTDTDLFDFGLGSYMKYAFTLDPLSQATTVTLAYLVIPYGQVVTINGTVSVLDNPTPFVLSPVIPEPASIGLLGVGTVSLLARRRRLAKA